MSADKGGPGEVEWNGCSIGRYLKGESGQEKIRRRRIRLFGPFHDDEGLGRKN